MQAVRFLHKAFVRALPNVHAKRLNTLMCAVSALLAGRRLTLTALGRFMPGDGQPRHAIKRVDRLLANPHLHAERPLFYLMMLRALLGSLKHPLVLVDWSPVDAPGCFFLLRAAILSISIQNFPGNSVQKFPVAQVLFTAFLRCLKRNESLPVSRMSQW